MIDIDLIRWRFEALRGALDERGRRLFAAAEARAAGFGGIASVARATGIAPSTIGRGLKDLGEPELAGGSVRRKGGGRPPLEARDPELLNDLQRLIEPATMGDPERPLRWVSKSWAKLAAALKDMGHTVSARSIPRLIETLGYRRQVNRKTREGEDHPDRDAHFEHINTQALKFQAAGQPVISVDTKKKELIGNYKNPGSGYRPRAHPDEVNVHDFPDKELGKAIPNGVYDISANAGWVSAGIDHDKAVSREERKAMVAADPGLSLCRQCRLLSVSRSSFYYAPTGESPENLAPMRRIDELFLKYPFYGSRQMARQLSREGVCAGRNRVRRLMRLVGLEAIDQAPKTSAPHPAHRIYPYLPRDVTVERADHVWCADITYIFPVRLSSRCGASSSI